MVDESQQSLDLSPEEVVAEPAAPPAPTTTYEQAVPTVTDGDRSAFVPVASLQDGPQQEGESRMDYLARLSRGSGMNRATG